MITGQGKNSTTTTLSIRYIACNSIKTVFKNLFICPFKNFVVNVLSINAKKLE